MPAIPAALVDGKLKSDFKIKSKLYNSYIAAECTIMWVHYQSVNVELKNVKVFITADEDNVFSTIKSLNAHKAYDWDNISIWMIQLCRK